MKIKKITPICRILLCLLALVMPVPLLLVGCAPDTPAVPPDETPDDPSDGSSNGEESLETVKNAVDDPVLPAAPIRASRVLLVSALSGANSLTAATLQGILANCSPEQILFACRGYLNYLPYLEEQGVTVARKNEKGGDWTVLTLLSRFSSHLKGYILCDADLKSESASVAVSLAGLLSAVVVTSSNEQAALDAGLTMVLDVRGKDDAWLRGSEYFGRLRTDMAVEQPVSYTPYLIDYAVMTGSYVYFYDGEDPDAHGEKFAFLDEGATVFGWNNTLGEQGTITSLSKLSIQMIPADYVGNLSTLSGFSLPELSLDQKPATGKVENKHTVCLILSDGDNLQFFLRDYATAYFGSSLRGTFPMGWGVPACATDLAAPMLSYYYENATEKDEFLLQLSGIGYTFPSLWDADARYDMANRLAAVMERMDLKYLEVLDDKGFDQELFYEFASREQVEGIFYIDFENYAGESGAILFEGDTPIVSARYRLWADVEDGSIEAIAAALNSASTDASSPDGYSFIIVHAWSGLNKTGELVSNGDTMAAVQALIEQLGDSVDVVGMDEFMTRIKNNVKH